MNYKKLYFYLFNRITDIENRLKEMQSAREEMYINIGESRECSLSVHSASGIQADEAGHSSAAN